MNLPALVEALHDVRTKIKELQAYERELEDRIIEGAAGATSIADGAFNTLARIKPPSLKFNPQKALSSIPVDALPYVVEVSAAKLKKYDKDLYEVCREPSGGRRKIEIIDD